MCVQFLRPLTHLSHFQSPHRTILSASVEASICGNCRSSMHITDFKTYRLYSKLGRARRRVGGVALVGGVKFRYDVSDSDTYILIVGPGYRHLLDTLDPRAESREMTSFSIFKKRQGQSNVANVQMTEVLLDLLCIVQ